MPPPHLWVNNKRPPVRVREDDRVFGAHAVRGQPLVVPPSDGDVISEQGRRVQSGGNSDLGLKGMEVWGGGGFACARMCAYV